MNEKQCNNTRLYCKQLVKLDKPAVQNIAIFPYCTDLYSGQISAATWYNITRCCDLLSFTEAENRRKQHSEMLLAVSLTNTYFRLLPLLYICQLNLLLQCSSTKSWRCIFMVIDIFCNTASFFPLDMGKD